MFYKKFYITKAKEILRKGDSLDVLNWHGFEKLIAELLASDGWNVSPRRRTKDDGIDIVSIKEDKKLGFSKVVWQIKKYKKSNPVGINIIRELYGSVSEHRASKGVIVTSSRLTKGALELIRKHKYIMFGLDGSDVEGWIYEQGGEDDDGKDLPF
jgi:restriction endonuclease Mrr